MTEKYNDKHYDSLTDQIVLCIDLLGFTEQVKDAGEDKDKNQKLINLLRFLKAHNGSKHSGDTVSVFSDTIVISCPLNNNNDIQIIKNLYAFSGYIGYHALSDGLLIRGGISKGICYHSNGVVYGQSLIDAHNLESKLACTPRIIFSKTFTFSENDLTSLIDNKILTLHEDDYYAINYIQYIQKFCSTEKELRKLKNIIDNNVNTIMDERGLFKWKWFEHEFLKINS